jgi:mannose-6-phosphate isomerase-like protein (cupin superfamily)
MDTKGFVVLPGQEPVWTMWNMFPGRSVALKLLSDQTAESLMMFAETAPVGTVTDFHLHRRSDEVACVLSGEFTFKIGDVLTVGGPGTCAFVPRGNAHAWKNTGVEAGRALFIYTPAEAGKLLEEFRRLQSTATPFDVDEFARIYQRYGWETLGPPPF